MSRNHRKNMPSVLGGRLYKIAHLGRSAQTLHSKMGRRQIKKEPPGLKPGQHPALVQHRAVAALKFIKRFSA